jgi:hypothetical protein
MTTEQIIVVIGGYCKFEHCLMKDSPDDIKSIQSEVSQRIKRTIRVYVSLINCLMVVNTNHTSGASFPPNVSSYIARQKRDLNISAALAFLTRGTIDPLLWLWMKGQLNKNTRIPIQAMPIFWSHVGTSTCARKFIVPVSSWT